MPFHTRRPKAPAVRLRRILARMAEDVTRYGRVRRHTALPMYDRADAKRLFRKRRKAHRAERRSGSRSGNGRGKRR